MARRAQLIDDGGERRTLVPPPDDWKALAKQDRRPWWQRFSAKTAHLDDPAMDLEYKLVSKASGLYGGTLGATMAFTIPGMRWLLAPLGTLPAWGGMMLPAICLGLVARYFFPLFHTYVRRKNLSELRAAYLKGTRCPSCGYSLVGQTPDGAGLVRCPECAAQWRLPETA